MSRPEPYTPVGALRAGRLIETPSGLLDLATGCRAEIASRVVAATAAPAWRAPAPGRAGVPDLPDRAVVDGWLTIDWLGRWTERLVHVATPAAEWQTDSGPVRVAERDGDVGVTRTDGPRAWCRLAAGARAAGLVPLHLSCLPYVFQAALPVHEWPPLMVGLPATALPPSWSPLLEAWLQRGGRVAGLALLRGLPPAWAAPAVPRACPLPAVWPATTAGATARVRHVRRAWRALPAAPICPAFIWIPPHHGDRTRMTHHELLDVTALLEEATRDEEALATACRSVRHHTQADHAAILVAQGGDARLMASDGPPGDSLQAWRPLCHADAPEAVASTFGWHAVGKHALEAGGWLFVCARWPTRDAAQPRQALLPVFARLVASHVRPLPPAVVAAPGLEQTLVGDSTVMRDVRTQIALAARAPFPVLVRGESGCGKELAARAIHALGQRRHRRCAAINCAALPDELLESELFGHVRGAFTGAATDRAGLFDEADGGTLFLDEVGELGGRAQAKLLRVLQDGEVRRVGENQARRVDVRIIAATNVSLEEAVRRGTFRADLFYRLDVVRVRMPALRERREDIPMLARHFWQDCTARVGSRARLEGRVLEALMRYDWPGNVRQLQNTLAALAVRVAPRGRVRVDDLPPEVRRLETVMPYLVRTGLDAARREFEATFVRDALSRAGGRPSQAARDLGLTRQGLSKLVRRLGLDEETASTRLP